MIVKNLISELCARIRVEKSLLNRRVIIDSWYAEAEQRRHVRVMYNIMAGGSLCCLQRSRAFEPGSYVREASVELRYVQLRNKSHSSGNDFSSDLLRSFS